jgi:hypothetical protein
LRGNTEAEGLESESAMEIDYSSDQPTEVATVTGEKGGEQDEDGSENDSESENEGAQRY